MEQQTSRDVWKSSEATPLDPMRQARWVPVLFFALMLVLLCAGLLAAYFQRPYSSDDVSIQVVVADWQLHGSHTVWMSPDTWVIKAPVYLLVGELLPNSPVALLVTAIILNVIEFGLFFVAYRFFVGRQPRLDEYLPIVWLTTLGFPVYDLLNLPNNRNVEIGFGLLMFMLVARSVSCQWTPGAAGERMATRVVGVLALILGGVALVGLLVYNDPLYLYMFIVPLGGALFIRWLRNGKWREGAALAVLGAAVSVAKLWAAVFARLHYSILSSSPRFITFDQVGHHVSLAVQGILYLFSADFFGAPTIQGHTFGELINFGLILLAFLTPLIIGVTRRQFAWWQWFIVLQPYFVVLVYVLSNQTVDITSVRYLILLPFYGAINLALLAASITNARVRLFFSAIILASATFNALPIARTISDGYQNGNTRELAIVRAAQRQGLTKGYADYWNGSINTYLSGDKIRFIPTTCTPVGVQFYAWLVDDAVLHRPATRSFYLYDSQAQSPVACRPSNLQKQFGRPVAVVQIDGHTTMYVYDHDITARLR